jgi:hypothetical protein
MDPLKSPKREVKLLTQTRTSEQEHAYLSWTEYYKDEYLIY